MIHGRRFCKGNSVTACIKHLCQQVVAIALLAICNSIKHIGRRPSFVTVIYIEHICKPNLL